MNYNTKEELINLYRDNYKEKYYKPFLELALTKLGNRSDTNTLGLTHVQRDGIQEKLSNSNITLEIFLSGLELLDFEQIDYVGW
jgi:hypothetical protein